MRESGTERARESESQREGEQQRFDAHADDALTKYVVLVDGRSLSACGRILISSNDLLPDYIMLPYILLNTRQSNVDAINHLFAYVAS